MADTKRLDWLEKRATIDAGNCDRESAYYYRIALRTGCDYYSGGADKLLREAIDAAMQTCG